MSCSLCQKIWSHGSSVFDLDRLDILLITNTRLFLNNSGIPTEPIVKTAFPSVVTMAIKEDPGDTDGITDVNVGDTVYLTIDLLDDGEC